MKTTLVIFLMLLIAFNSNGQVADTSRELTTKQYWDQTTKERHRYSGKVYTKAYEK